MTMHVLVISKCLCLVELLPALFVPQTRTCCVFLGYYNVYVVLATWHVQSTKLLYSGRS